jgi:phytoene dehydrogenase-like protein
VVLESGDEVKAAVVLSSVDPNQTFLKFIDDRELPGDFVEEVRRYKFRGSSGKVNLALDALPHFTCLPGDGPHLRGALSISPSVEYMERAYDQAKYGEVFAPTVHRYGDPVPHGSVRLHHPVSTSSRASSNTRPISWPAARGTNSARRSAMR